MLKSDQINELAAALAKAQGEFATPQKKRKAKVQMRAEKGGGTYEYNYADLADIMAAIVPALSKNGLALLQPIDAETNRLTTLLIHSSGQFYSATYNLPQGLTAQAFGSALTYARRYSLSLVGIVAEDDDDAGLAQPASARGVKAAKGTALVRPNPSGQVAPPTQAAGGTAGPALKSMPPGMTMADIERRTMEGYRVLQKLKPDLDLASEIYARYGATQRKDLSVDEAYDLLIFMENEIKKGTAV